MNRFFCFLAVGLAFTVLQVATVEAQDTAAGLVTGANAPADCGGVPCPTGDDAGEDCAAEETPALVAACWDRNKPALGDHPPGDDGVALTIDDPRCIVAPEARDHRCPGFVAP